MEKFEKLHGHLEMVLLLAKIKKKNRFSVFTKNFSNHKPTGPVNHENPQAQILFCWPEKK